MNNKGLIIFDFDGTLGDTRKTIVTTMQMTIRELQLPDRSEAACASTIGLPLAGCFMGIAETITYLIGADDVEQAKPYPEPVLTTLKALHFEASQTLVVGDMSVDILMGANAGAKTCGVTWGNGTREELAQAGADYIIDRIEDLLEIVAAARR